MTAPDSLWGACVGDVVELHDGDDVVRARVVSLLPRRGLSRRSPVLVARLLSCGIEIDVFSEELIARVLPEEGPTPQEAADG